MTEREWPTQRVQVDPTPPENKHFVEFEGKELGNLPLIASAQGAEEEQHVFFTFYETPEGYKVLVVASTHPGPGDNRPPGREAAMSKTTRRLLTLEDAKQEYPTVEECLERVLARDQE